MTNNLFSQDQPAENHGSGAPTNKKPGHGYVPLADRMRPATLDEVVGQFRDMAQAFLPRQYLHEGAEILAKLSVGFDDA